MASNCYQQSYFFVLRSTQPPAPELLSVAADKHAQEAAVAAEALFGTTASALPELVIAASASDGLGDMRDEIGWIAVVAVAAQEYQVDVDCP